jgi:hypothetical protein
LRPTWRHVSAVAGPAVALLLAGAAVALASPRAGKYRGSAGSLPLVFGVASGGKSITNFEPTFVGNCTKRGHPKVVTPTITTDAGLSLAVAHSGFSARGVNGEIRTKNHLIATGTDQVSGHFVTQHSAKGTYSVQFTFNKFAPAPYPGYHCSTGTLNWTAAHV